MTGPTNTQRPALVVAAHGRRGRLEDDRGRVHAYVVRGRQLRVVCGDWVTWEPGQSDEVTVTDVQPRDNSLLRLDPGRKSTEILAANLTLVAIVCAIEPRPDWYVIDRFLCAAAHMRSRPVLVVNKCELGLPDSRALQVYADASYPVLEVSARTGQGIDSLRERFTGETGILVGQSGVGKSSLINRLAPGTEVSTQGLTAGTGEGRHTTAASVMHSLPDGGRLIDAPGVRDFLPAIDDERSVQLGFAEILAAAEDCRFTDCRHLREPGCAVKAAVEAGSIDDRRYESYRRLLRNTQAAQSG